jgi:hypothetical protein
LSKSNGKLSWERSIEMNIGTVKTGKDNRKLSICTMDKRRASRGNSDAAISTLSAGNSVLDILENKGRVYGIYREKELVGIYIYERINDFFVKEKSKDADGKTEKRIRINNVKEFFEMTDDDLSEFDGWLYGESKAIFRLVSKGLFDEIEGYKADIEKYIVADLKSQIEWGQISGVLSGEKLIYRRSLDKTGIGAAGYGLGYGAGFIIGAIFGWLVFDSISMGLMWGVCFASIGGLLSTNVTSKQEWMTFDLVNKKYAGVEEDK